MESTNFSHTLSISRIRTAKSGIVQFKVNYNWSWKHNPTFHSTDNFGLAWNNNYSVVKNSPKHSYNYFFLHNITRELVSSGGVQQNSYYRIEPGTGIGWKVNLVSNGTPIEHNGWSTATLEKGHDQAIPVFNILTGQIRIIYSREF